MHPPEGRAGRYELTRFAQGLGFLEGPRWHDGRLFASNPLEGTVLSCDRTGAAQVLFEVSGHPNGLGWSPDGRLMVVSMAGAVLRVDDDGRLATFAETGDIAAGSLNDMVVTASGYAFVSTLATNAIGAELSELNRPSGLVCIAPDGTVRAVGGDLLFPNGLAVMSDGVTLLVAETFGARISAFTIADDGSLSARRDWHVFDARPEHLRGEGAWAQRPAPDGVAIDAQDGLWVADAGGSGVFRIVAGLGVTDFVDTGELAVVAVALGGHDGRTLFMCAGPRLENGPVDPALQWELLSTQVEIGAW